MLLLQDSFHIETLDMDSFTQTITKTTLVFCIIVLNLSTQSLAIKTQFNSSTNTQFIKKTCGVTMYPKLCIKSLSSYPTPIQSSPSQLANAALNVALQHAKRVSDSVSALSKRGNLGAREVGVIKDCLENIGDSIDELQKSIVELEDLEGQEFEVKMRNLLTWVSAALTDEDTCMDGVKTKGVNAEIKSIIRGNVVKFAQLTSNALAIINSMSSN